MRAPSAPVSVNHLQANNLKSHSDGREHILRLYENETSLYSTVADLMCDGIAHGDPCLLIATRRHLSGVSEQLKVRGHDCDSLERNGRLTKVDAHDILTRIAPGPGMDAAACRRLLDDLVSGAAGQSDGRLVIYGEIVDLLCKRGEPETAVRLEQIWNDLLSHRPIKLLCGYDADMFSGEDGASLERVCNEHSVCVPSDDFMSSDEHARLRQIVVLEQRARELETEIQRRRAATEELARFNRAAVGREMRIIELKNEVNELCARLGESPRYSPARERQTCDLPASPAEEHRSAAAPLESILLTHELARRPTRPPQYETEQRALIALLQALADSPRTILQSLADKVIEVLQADSAGLSLLTDDGERFYWAAIAGMWKPHLGGGTPRDFGPCGDVLDCERPLLFTHWERRYPYLSDATPLAEEGLLVPFFVRGKASGTIWAIAHNPDRKFDSEDLRLLESLGRFASAAYQAVEALSVFDQRRAALSLLEDSRRMQDSLREANARLARANDDLSHFAFAASHDLQEPLRMITMYSQLLVRKCADHVDDDASTCIRFITDGTNRMQQLLTDLLAYTRLTDESGELTCSAVDLDSAFDKAVENCRALFVECQPAITRDPLPTVQGHEPHFVQLFQNLVGNALKYRSERPPRIHVSAKREDGYWRVSVQDNGIGIDPQFHQKIFGVFKRLHGKSVPGTGIGLAICQRVVERYGGRIWVESEKDEGATFCFTLPIPEQPAPASSEEPPVSAPKLES
jgi:signal transduction histidine kinase